MGITADVLLAAGPFYVCATDVADDAFKLEGDDSLFSIPDYVPTELPDLAALGSGK